MNNPLVSVIIPNYNHARFLDERIQSVLNQTYQNYELIILDDKSTDNSVEVIYKFKDNSHISQIIINDENSGSPFKQWHKGFELAKGDIIWIAESDDNCEKDMLEKLVDVYIKNNCVIAFCRSRYMDENGFKGEECLWQKSLKKSLVLQGKAYIANYLWNKNTIVNASSVIFDRNFALQIEPDFMTFKGSGDWMFWIEMAEKGNVAFIDEALNYFRKHHSNTTQIMNKSGLSILENNKIFRYLIKKKLISKKQIFDRKRGVLYRLKYEYIIPEDVKIKGFQLWGMNSYYYVVTWLMAVIYRIK